MAQTTKQVREAMAARLREALGPRSRWWLAEQLAPLAAKDRALRGITESSIRNYLSAKHTPSLEFLRAAAEVLGVDFTWLAAGEMTVGANARMQLDEAFRARGVAVAGQQMTAAQGTPRVSGDAPGESAFVGDDPLLRALDQRHRLALLEMAREGLAVGKASPTDADLRAAGKAIAAALRVPAQLTGTGNPTETLDAWHLARYVDAYLTAARLGVPRIQAGGKGKTSKPGKRKGG